MSSADYTARDHRAAPEFLTVGRVSIPYIGRETALDVIDHSLRQGQHLNLAFCNANTMLMALRRADYAETLTHFFVLNDGIGLDLCSWIFHGRRFADNLNGTDFMPYVLEETTRPLRLYLLGSRPGIAEVAAARLSERFPRHVIAGCHDGYFSDDEADAVIAAINLSQADMVLVGMGNPRQEHFIARHRDAIAAPVLVAVGAYLDFTAGAFARAPSPVRRLRLEWAWRLMLEPRRLARRYTIDIAEFLLRIARLRARAIPSEAVPHAAEVGARLSVIADR